MLDRPPAAAATETRLHLVRDQQGMVVVGYPSQALEEFGRSHDNAALAHDRLDHDAGDVGAFDLDGIPQLLERALSRFRRPVSSAAVGVGIGGADHRESLRKALTMDRLAG